MSCLKLAGPAFSAGGGRFLASGVPLASCHPASAALQTKRVVLVVIPAGWVALDVFADSVEAGFKPASTRFHRFVVIALPDGMEVGVCPEPFRDTDFEPADD